MNEPKANQDGRHRKGHQGARRIQGKLHQVGESTGTHSPPGGVRPHQSSVCQNRRRPTEARAGVREARTKVRRAATARRGRYSHSRLRRHDSDGREGVQQVERRGSRHPGRAREEIRTHPTGRDATSGGAGCTTTETDRVSEARQNHERAHARGPTYVGNRLPRLFRGIAPQRGLEKTAASTLQSVHRHRTTGKNPRENL